jgi:four helix bundle protein
MIKNNILKDKSFDFAVRIIKLYKYLRKSHTEYELSNQLVRSGTAVGALVRESEHAESRKDFIHKLSIGLKEINECVYWLELLFATEFIDRKIFESIHKDGTELLKILTASVKTAKSRL